MSTNNIYQVVMDKLRLGARSALLVSLAAIAILFLFTPQYARSPGHMLALQLSCVPDRVEFTFPEEGYKLVKAEISIDELGPNGIVAAQLLPPMDLRISHREGSPTAEAFLTETAAPKARAASASKASIRTAIILMFQRVPAIDIRAITIRGEFDSGHRACEAEEFRGHRVLELLPEKKGVQVRRTRKVQEVWADYLLLFNSSIGNALLAMLSAVLLWAMLKATNASKRLWDVRAQRLDQVTSELIQAHPGKSVRALKDHLASEYSQHCWWPNFWKVLGPAIGFLLTVSSLAAALHPSVQTAKDGYAFVSAIEIAVVSTFVGLAVRIFSHLDTSLRLAAIRKIGAHIDQSVAAQKEGP